MNADLDSRRLAVDVAHVLFGAFVLLSLASLGAALLGAFEPRPQGWEDVR